MKIIQVIPQLGPGGAERFVTDLSNEISILGNTVYLCVLHSLESNGFYKHEVSNNVHVISFNKKKGMDFLLFFRMFFFVRRIQPDIVHTHLNSIMYLILSIFFFRKIKFFHTVHNVAEIETEGKLGAFVRKILFKFDLVNPVTISQKSKNLLLIIIKEM